MAWCTLFSAWGNPACSFLCTEKWLRLCVWAGMPTMSTRQLSVSTCSRCWSDIPLANSGFSSFEVYLSHISLLITLPFVSNSKFDSLPAPAEFPLRQWAEVRWEDSKREQAANTSQLMNVHHVWYAVGQSWLNSCVLVVRFGCDRWRLEKRVLWVLWVWSGFSHSCPAFPSRPGKQYKRNVALTNTNEKMVNALKQWCHYKNK